MGVPLLLTWLSSNYSDCWHRFEKHRLVLLRRRQEELQNRLRRPRRDHHGSMGSSYLPEGAASVSYYIAIDLNSVLHTTVAMAAADVHDVAAFEAMLLSRIVLEVRRLVTACEGLYPTKPSATAASAGAPDSLQQDGIAFDDLQADGDQRGLDTLSCHSAVTDRDKLVSLAAALRQRRQLDAIAAATRAAAAKIASVEGSAEATASVLRRSSLPAQLAVNSLGLFAAAPAWDPRDGEDGGGNDDVMESTSSSSDDSDGPPLSALSEEARRRNIASRRETQAAKQPKAEPCRGDELVLIIASDGVPPTSKFEAQRQRRLEDNVVTLGGNATWPLFHLTAGTPFMRRVDAAMADFAREWCACGRSSNAETIAAVVRRCIVVDSSVPGEGEHKIIRALRTDTTMMMHTTAAPALSSPSVVGNRELLATVQNGQHRVATIVSSDTDVVVASVPLCDRFHVFIGRPEPNAVLPTKLLNVSLFVAKLLGKAHLTTPMIAPVDAASLSSPRLVMETVQPPQRPEDSGQIPGERLRTTTPLGFDALPRWLEDLAADSPTVLPLHLFGGLPSQPASEEDPLLERGVHVQFLYDLVVLLLAFGNDFMPGLGSTSGVGGRSFGGLRIMQGHLESLVELHLETCRRRIHAWIEEQRASSLTSPVGQQQLVSGKLVASSAVPSHRSIRSDKVRDHLVQPLWCLRRGVLHTVHLSSLLRAFIDVDDGGSAASAGNSIQCRHRHDEPTADASGSKGAATAAAVGEKRSRFGGGLKVIGGGDLPDFSTSAQADNATTKRQRLAVRRLCKDFWDALNWVVTYFLGESVPWAWTAPLSVANLLDRGGGGSGSSSRASTAAAATAAEGRGVTVQPPLPANPPTLAQLSEGYFIDDTTLTPYLPDTLQADDWSTHTNSGSSSTTLGALAIQTYLRHVLPASNRDAGRILAAVASSPQESTGSSVGVVRMWQTVDAATASSRVNDKNGFHAAARQRHAAMKATRGAMKATQDDVATETGDARRPTCPRPSTSLLPPPTSPVLLAYRRRHAAASGALVINSDRDVTESVLAERYALRSLVHRDDNIDELRHKILAVVTGGGVVTRETPRPNVPAAQQNVLNISSPSSDAKIISGSLEEPTAAGSEVAAHQPAAVASSFEINGMAWLTSGWSSCSPTNVKTTMTKA